ncbi:extracellular solute-binding protein [Ruminiclostridium cellobioparum]|uniref:extracellular solute-binding protein n=1 Tax=Ruminiclostridium cellobioparum TaxID=29355 RepID=UPI0028A66D2B|nr:extracellular solute-binding protein [Ruminiclostridium cellobioparum]
MAKIRKVIALIMVAVMAVVMFAGCGGASKETGAANSTKAAVSTAAVSSTQQTDAPKEKVKLSFFLSQTGWGGEAVDPELMAEVEKVIEGKTNTDLEVIAPPQSSYNDKLNVVLASGDIPDIFAVRKAMDNIHVMASRGYTMPLDDLIKQAPEITSLVDQTYLDYLKVDGKLQGVPMYVPLSKFIWMRKDVMDANGVKLSETPTTDEFYNEMKKLVGKGVIPFTFAKFLDNLPFFFNPFDAYYGIGEKDGKYIDGFNTPEAKEALAYVAKLYKEKIWDQEFLTNENTTIRENLFSGKAASTLDYYNRYIYFCTEAENVKAPTEFVPIYELKGPKGQGGNLYEAIQDALCISSKSKNPDRALDVLKYYVYSEEGVKLRCLGVEGKHYTLENNIITPTEKAKNSGYKCDVNQFYLYYPKITDFGFKWSETIEKLIPLQVKFNEETNRHLGPKYSIPSNKSDLYNKNLSGYKKKIDEISSKIIMGSCSVDEGYKEYEAFWKSINGDGMLAELNK